MPRSKWNEDDRKLLLDMIAKGIPEQDIREQFGGMSSSEFAIQLKIAMIEAGQIKQAPRIKKESAPRVFTVTKSGRLTIANFADETGFAPGTQFVIQRPRGRSNAWRLVRYEGERQGVVSKRSRED